MALTEARRCAYLKAMRVPVWQRRRAGDRPAPPAATPSLVAVRTSQPTSNPAQMEWPELADAVRACQACALSETRRHTVFGVGDRNAQLMIIGEAPGAEEDRRGEPFVGAAGQLLDAMLKAIELRREQVYISNILKCRPPQNRDPKADEAAACSAYLARQLALVAPRLIIAVGRVAVQNLLNTERPVGKLRGHVHHYGEAKVPLVVTYHPAYLLRKPAEKRKAWEDLKLVRRLLKEV